MAIVYSKLFNTLHFHVTDYCLQLLLTMLWLSFTAIHHSYTYVFELQSNSLVNINCSELPFNTNLNTYY